MNTEIINQIIEMLKTGASYSEIQYKLGVYPVQIKRIKDKFININNNTNVSTNDKNSNTNSKNNNTNISTNKEKELELKLQQGRIEFLKLQQQHEIELEKIKTQRDEIETQKDEIELENFAIKLKHETELKKMQDKLEQFKKETAPDEPEEENELPEPQVNDVVIWKNKNIEGYINGIEDNIAKVKFGRDEVIAIPFNLLIDNGEEWLFDYDFENVDRQRKISRNRFFRRH